MPNTEHVPNSEGRCRIDGQEWPAGDERAMAELQRDYASAPLKLFVYLTQHIVDAARRDPKRPWTDIARQYVGWVPPGSLFLRPPDQAPRGIVYGGNSRWSR